MNIKYDVGFDDFEDKIGINEENRYRVFEVYPDCHGDGRGYFMEVLKDHNQYPKDNLPMWFTNLNWVRQINRSVSKSGVLRGCHA